ncbi:MAG: hypothetical protein RMN24_02300 [Anaerolineae bacterium]|nr:hypothetical protein [Caldilineales bacterium]MCX7852559.1 hypothetical protein [Caldilineales bacterium]MDW8267973.1 hypothetical protein [Anaerolineae bacterium]
MKRLSGPVKAGLIAASLAILLVVIGILRGNVPLNPLSILLALLIGGGSWGVVVWAIATAALDVEHDIAEEERGGVEGG